MAMKPRSAFQVLRLVALLTVVMSTLSAAPTARAQWTQWGGPNRDFIADSKGLADKWPDEGPKELWRRELGDGYSTIISDGKTLYTMYRKDQDEFTVALDARTGQTVWEHKYPSPTTSLMEQFGAGPHSTPLLVENRLFTIGTNAVLHCFDKSTGKVLWKIDLHNDMGAGIPGRGYGCSPIAYKSTIIVPAGRPRGGDGDADAKKEAADQPPDDQSLVAFDQLSGSVIWKSGDYPVAYASPSLIDFQGERQLVQLGSLDLVGVNPDNGDLLWRLGITPEAANISTPVYDGKEMLFCSSAYDSGSRVIKLTKKNGKTEAEQLWYGRKMRMHHCDAVRIGDYIYGSSGDFGPAFYMGVNFKTGDVAWRERGFKKANSLYADGRMIILDEDGQLALAKVTPEGLEVISKCTVAERYAWAAPTLVGKTLYVRDRKHILALDLG